LVDAAVGGVDDAQDVVNGDFGVALRVDDAVIELLHALHLLAGGGRAQGHALGRVLLALAQPADKPILRARRQEDTDGVGHQAAHRGRALHIDAQDDIAAAGQCVADLLLGDALEIVEKEAVKEKLFIGE